MTRNGATESPCTAARNARSILFKRVPPAAAAAADGDLLRTLPRRLAARSPAGLTLIRSSNRLRRSSAGRRPHRLAPPQTRPSPAPRRSRGSRIGPHNCRHRTLPRRLWRGALLVTEVGRRSRGDKNADRGNRHVSVAPTSCGIADDVHSVWSSQVHRSATPHALANPPVGNGHRQDHATRAQPPDGCSEHDQAGQAECSDTGRVGHSSAPKRVTRAVRCCGHPPGHCLSDRRQ